MDEAKEKRPKRQEKWKKKRPKGQENLKKKRPTRKRMTKMEYWRRVGKSSGFELEGLELKGPAIGRMRVFNNLEPNAVIPLVITLYAKMGLHWYNLLERTNYQFLHIEKYNRTYKYMPSSYYITLVAYDPVSSSRTTFQTRLHESAPCKMDVSCSLTRLQPPKGVSAPVVYDVPRLHFIRIRPPEWPSNLDTFKDKHRYYELQESDLENYDWIRLYLDLAFVTTNRRIYNPNMSALKILKVVLEAEDVMGPPSDRLKGARDATIYIDYELNLGEGRVSTFKAAVKRTVDLLTRRFLLIGTNPKLALHEEKLMMEISQ